VTIGVAVIGLYLLLVVVFVAWEWSRSAVARQRTAQTAQRKPAPGAETESRKAA
jgi:hypothetical protein